MDLTSSLMRGARGVESKSATDDSSSRRWFDIISPRSGAIFVGMVFYCPPLPNLASRNQKTRFMSFSIHDLAKHKYAYHRDRFDASFHKMSVNKQ